MPISFFPIYQNLTTTLTGWTSSDPNRLCCEVPVVIDNLAWASAVGFSVSGHCDSISPFSHNVNMPVMEYMSDVVGWRELGTFSGGTGGGTVGGTIPPANASQTMSFRINNSHDSILGLYTPRTITNLSVFLAVSPPIGSVSALLMFGVGGSPEEPVITVTARGFAQVVG